MKAGLRRVAQSVAALACAVGLASVGLPGAAETADTTPPEVVDFGITPETGDTTDTPASFTATMRVTDGGSGVSQVKLEWQQPGGDPRGVEMLRVAGGAADGTYQTTITIPWGSPPGDYTLGGSVQDAAANRRAFRPAELESWGFPSAFEVTNADPDTGPPVVTATSGSPATVDVREAPATFELTVNIIDDKVGVKWASVSFYRPDGTHGGVRAVNLERIAGDAMDGTWFGTATVPEHVREGAWTYRISLSDGIYYDNVDSEELEAAGLQSGFEVLSIEDTATPVVVDGSISPAEVRVDDLPQVVRMRYRVTDDIAGVSSVYFSLTEPCCSTAAHGGFATRISGDAFDGWYEKEVTLPGGSEVGRWRAWLGVSDMVSNARYWFAMELEERGIVSEFAVYSLPSPPDPYVVETQPGAVRLRWAPAFDGGSAVTSYVVREQPQGKVRSVPPGPHQTEVTLDGLHTGAHQVTVEAVNKAGASAPSAPVGFEVPPPATTPSTTTTTAPAPSGPRSGYWMLDEAGGVFSFGDAAWFGTPMLHGVRAADIESTPSGDGYWIVDEAGHVHTFGDAPWFGSAVGETVTSMSSTPSGLGYWLFTSGGRVLPFGDASFFGDMTGVSLNGPVLDSVATPSGHGYYMVASDGGVFAFGDAAFAGSMGGVELNEPVQSLVPDGDGSGYWLVASDGGIFAFAAPFYGSMGGVSLNQPVTGMVGSRTGTGYLMVAADGGIFTFGDVPFHGSMGASPPASPVVAVAAL